MRNEEAWGFWRDVHDVIFQRFDRASNHEEGLFEAGKALLEIAPEYISHDDLVSFL